MRAAHPHSGTPPVHRHDTLGGLRRQVPLHTVHTTYYCCCSYLFKNCSFK